MGVRIDLAKLTDTDPPNRPADEPATRRLAVPLPRFLRRRNACSPAREEVQGS